jgi:hypothetical protein
MPGVPPPPDFAHAKLEIETIPSGQTFGRIYWSTYPDPLGYGKSPSRFSDPRRRAATNRFGVLYLGDSLKVCFLEAVLRDRRQGVVDDHPIEEVELTQRRYAEIATTAGLRLVDLRGDNAVRMGVPTDVARAQRQNLARRWSVAPSRCPWWQSTKAETKGRLDIFLPGKCRHGQRVPHGVTHVQPAKSAG